VCSGRQISRSIVRLAVDIAGERILLRHDRILCRHIDTKFALPGTENPSGDAHSANGYEVPAKKFSGEAREVVVIFSHDHCPRPQDIGDDRVANPAGVDAMLGQRLDHIEKCARPKNSFAFEIHHRLTRSRELQRLSDDRQTFASIVTP